MVKITKLKYIILSALLIFSLLGCKNETPKEVEEKSSTSIGEKFSKIKPDAENEKSVINEETKIVFEYEILPENTTLADIYVDPDMSKYKDAKKFETGYEHLYEMSTVVIVPRYSNIHFKLGYGYYDVALDYFQKNVEVFDFIGEKNTPYVTSLPMTEGIPNFILTAERDDLTAEWLPVNDGVDGNMDTELVGAIKRAKDIDADSNFIPLLAAQGIYVIEHNINDLQEVHEDDTAFWPVIQTAISINPPNLMEPEDNWYYIEPDLINEYSMALFYNKESFPLSDDRGIIEEYDDKLGLFQIKVKDNGSEYSYTVHEINHIEHTLYQVIFSVSKDDKVRYFAAIIEDTLDHGMNKPFDYKMVYPVEEIPEYRPEK